MPSPASPYRASYRKTTLLACLAGAAAALAALAAWHWLPRSAAGAAAPLAGLVAFAALVLAGAGALVLARDRRMTEGRGDLFLALNRTRESQAVAEAAPTQVPAWRRRLARRLLGHELIVGDLVEVRPWEEIRATLDGQGCLDGLPFMPEMLALCGRRMRVFKSMHRLFDYRKSRQMRHMDGAVLLVGAVCDGSRHGGCEAACHSIWKAAWLRRVSASDAALAAAAPAASPAHAWPGTEGPHYRCQLTELQAASRPVGDWSPVNFVRPLVSGNVAPAAFAVGWLTHLFNLVQRWRGGVGFPTLEPPAPGFAPQDDLRLQPGDAVRVRPSAELRAAMNEQLAHRGLYFEEDMLKHCGQRQVVQAEVRRLIDIVSGEMRTMKTPAYLLRGVHFSGERQMFNAQYEPLFWRAAWLQVDG